MGAAGGVDGGRRWREAAAPGAAGACLVVFRYEELGRFEILWAAGTLGITVKLLGGFWLPVAFLLAAFLP